MQNDLQQKGIKELVPARPFEKKCKNYFVSHQTWLVHEVCDTLGCAQLGRPDILADFPDTFFWNPWGMYERP